MEKEFETIMKCAIEEAEFVPCDMEEFRKGLVTMWHVLQQRLEMEGVNPTAPEYCE